MSKIPVAHGSRIPLPHKHGAASKPGTSHIPAANAKNEISGSFAATETRPSPVSLHEIENFQNVNREPLTDTTDSEISDATSCIKEVHPPHPQVFEVGASQRRAPSNQRMQSSQEGSVHSKSSNSMSSHGSTTRTTDIKTAALKSSNLTSTIKKPAVNVNPPPAPAAAGVVRKAPAPQPAIAARTSHRQLSSTASGGTKSKTGSRSTTPTYNKPAAAVEVPSPPVEKKITSKTLKAQMTQSSHHLFTEMAKQPIAQGVDGAELLCAAMAMIDSTVSDMPFALPSNLSQPDAQLDAFIDEAQYKTPHQPYAYLVQLPRLTAEIQQQVQLVTAESGLDFAKLVSELNEVSGRQTI